MTDGQVSAFSPYERFLAAVAPNASPVAGRADVLIVPDLEAGNMLAKGRLSLAGALAAGSVLGPRMPITLTSRADSLAIRIASCAVASLVAATRGSPAGAATQA